MVDFKIKILLIFRSSFPSCLYECVLMYPYLYKGILSICIFDRIGFFLYLLVVFIFFVFWWTFVSSVWTFVAASASSTVVPYLDKTDFLKLQNGRLVPLDYKHVIKFRLLKTAIGRGMKPLDARTDPWTRLNFWWKPKKIARSNVS
jgi:hypothetical protein